MRKWHDSLRRFLSAEDGPTDVEYSVMLAMIIVVCINAVIVLGSDTHATFNSVAMAGNVASS